MRVLGLLTMGALVLGSSTDLAAQDQPPVRIGYIDSQLILSQAPGASEAEAEYERQRQSFERELSGMLAELDSLVSQYQRQEAALLANIRLARQQEIQSREQRYNDRLQQIEEEDSQMRQRLMQPILNQMVEAIEQVRVEEGLALMFDAAAQSIVAADESLDYSQHVLARLQQMASAPSPQP